MPASRDVLRQVRRIDLRTRGLVNSRFSGEYHSVFKGQGIEFAEVRQYLPGDDADRARRLFRRRQVDEIRLRTDAPYNRELLSFFQRRERRLRR